MQAGTATKMNEYVLETMAKQLEDRVAEQTDAIIAGNRPMPVLAFNVHWRTPYLFNIRPAVMRAVAEEICGDRWEWEVVETYGDKCWLSITRYIDERL